MKRLILLITILLLLPALVWAETNMCRRFPPYRNVDLTFTDGALYMGGTPNADITAGGRGSGSFFVTTTAGQIMSIQHGSNDANSFAAMNIMKSRATDGSGNTIVQNNDYLGSIRWYPADGVDYAFGAEIVARVDGTPGSNDMPLEIVFRTSPDGAQSPADRWSVEADGDLNSFTTGACIILKSPDGSSSECCVDNADAFSCTGL